jgi:SAM-dependent methyltransferase
VNAPHEGGAPRLPDHLQVVRESYRRTAVAERDAELAPRLQEALDSLRREALPDCTVGSLALREYLAPARGQRFLDVGCGADLIVHRLDAWPSVFHGVDVCEAFLSETRRFATRRAIPLGSLALAHAAGLPYRSEVFDMLACVGVLEYGPLAYVQEALAEMARVLRPRGRAVVDFPNAAHPQIDAVREIETCRGRPIHVPAHDAMISIAQSLFSIEGVSASRAMTQLFLARPARRPVQLGRPRPSW